MLPGEAFQIVKMDRVSSAAGVVLDVRQSWQYHFIEKADLGGIVNGHRALSHHLNQ